MTSAFKTGSGTPMPIARDIPYPVMSRPRTYLESICFMSPITARVLAPATGTPLTSSTFVLNCVPCQETYPSPPARNILVPTPMTSQ